MSATPFFFYLFSIVLIASAVMVISSKNPVHSVLFLILAFVNAAGLFLLLEAEFLAMILVVVYVGAVAVLFLFVVMMLDVDFAEMRQGFLKYATVGALVGVIVVLELGFVVGSWTIGQGSFGQTASPAPALPNTVALGSVIYTQYLVLFQAAGLVLLTAMIGAIVLTLQHRPLVKRQSIPEQNARSTAAVELKKVSSRQGVDAWSSERCDDQAVHMIGLGQYLTVAAIVFTLGVAGIILNRKNIIIILMSVELILLSVNLNLVAFSSFLHDLTGQVFALFILTVAAAEAAIGLAILVTYYRNSGTIAVEDINAMKG